MIYRSLPQADHEVFDILKGEAQRELESLFLSLGFAVLGAGTFALTSRDYFDDAVGRAAQLGFTDVITHWPRPEGPYAGDESVLEAVAAQLVGRHG